MAKETAKRVLVTGGKMYASVAQMTEVLDEIIAEGDTIVTGDVGSAEKLAAAYAEARGIDLELHLVDWDYVSPNGRKSGWVMRNNKMLRANIDRVLVFDFDAKEDKSVLNIMEEARKFRLAGSLVAAPPGLPEAPAWDVIG